MFSIFSLIKLTILKQKSHLKEVSLTFSYLISPLNKINLTILLPRTVLLMCALLINIRGSAETQS